MFKKEIERKNEFINLYYFYSLVGSIENKMNEISGSNINNEEKIKKDMLIIASNVNKLNQLIENKEIVHVLEKYGLNKNIAIKDIKNLNIKVNYMLKLMAQLIKMDDHLKEFNRKNKKGAIEMVNSLKNFIPKLKDSINLLKEGKMEHIRLNIIKELRYVAKTTHFYPYFFLPLFNYSVNYLNTHKLVKNIQKLKKQPGYLTYEKYRDFIQSYLKNSNQLTSLKRILKTYDWTKKIEVYDNLYNRKVAVKRLDVIMPQTAVPFLKNQLLNEKIKIKDVAVGLGIDAATFLIGKGVDKVTFKMLAKKRAIQLGEKMIENTNLIVDKLEMLNKDYLNKIGIKLTKEDINKIVKSYSTKEIEETFKILNGEIKSDIANVLKKQYRETYIALTNIGISRKDAEIISLFAITSEKTKYSIIGHQIRVGRFISWVGKKINDKRITFLGYGSTAHDVGKAIFEGNVLKAEKNSAIHMIDSKIVRHINENKIEKKYEGEIIKIAIRDFHVDDTKNINLFRNNIYLAASLDHHNVETSYIFEKLFGKDENFARGLLMFSDSWDAALMPRKYEMMVKEMETVHQPEEKIIKDIAKSFKNRARGLFQKGNRYNKYEKFILNSGGYERLKILVSKYCEIFEPKVENILKHKEEFKTLVKSRYENFDKLDSFIDAVINVYKESKKGSPEHMAALYVLGNML